MERKRTVWQIAGGPVERSYADIFLKYGVALIGPGDPGRWTPERYGKDSNGRFVRQIATEVKTGDVFLLRKGMSTIRAIGIVADNEYLYLEQFDDVNGWDLQHCRRVRWCKLSEEHNFHKKVFSAKPDRLSRSEVKEVIDFAERFLNSPPKEWQKACLPDLPPEEPILRKIPIFLKQIVAEVQDLTPLYWNREKFGEEWPSEDEMIAHFVVPFLRCFGWPPECIAVQWRNIDVAVFKNLPRNRENCCFIIEAKSFGTGIEKAFGQAKRYLEKHSLSCDIIVTDGIRYRIYDHRNDFGHVAYANLSNLKESAIELFERLKRG